MKVTLIYPPDHRIPHSLYLSLPELAGSLRNAGHEVIMRDLNMEVLNLLLNRQLLEGYHEYMEAAWDLFRRKEALSPGETIEKQFIETIFKQPRDLALRGEEAVRTFYDEERFYRPEAYRDALDVLDAGLPFLFGSIVGLSPYVPDYLKRMEQILSHPQDDPVIHVLRTGLVDSILAAEPDLVGITMPYQENIMEGFRLAALLRREEPCLPIVVGGPQVTKYREQLFRDNTLFDFIRCAVIYEGNTALVKLVDVLGGKGALGEIPNLYWSEEGRVRFNGVGPPEDLNALPTPCYEGVNLDQYLKPEPIYGLMTSRGCCWKRCSFCSEAFHSRFAMRSSKQVYEDVKALVERHGARHIFFWDSLLPPRTMRELAERINADGLEVNWFADTKFYDHYARPDYVAFLHRAGLQCLQFGLESANQRVLDLMRKGTKIDKVPRILKTLHDGGVMNQISWFAGFPTESSEEFSDTLRFFDAHRDVIDLNVFIGSFYFEFGTYLSEHPEEFDAEILDVGGDYHLRCRSGMGREEIEQQKQRYLETSDMDLLCHGGYFLYHANRGLSPMGISRSRERSFMES